MKVTSGQWKVESNRLIYSLKYNYSKRLIYPDIFLRMQKTKRIKDYEAELFKIYSSGEDDDIELELDGFTKNGFIAIQKLGGKNYKSYCTEKSKANSEVDKLLSIYRKIHKLD